MIDWLALYWTVTALGAFLATGRNWYLAVYRWQLLQKRGVREALEITAFTPVRTHGILMYVHFTFLLLGLRRLFPNIFDDFEVNVILIAFLVVPILLIIGSLTMHADGARVIDLERE